MQGVLAGRYRLERQLGKGGMGSVWLAEHLALRSWVAVKLMDPAIAATPEGAERFRREAQAAASLRSAHVVQVLDYGVHEQTPYLVMELLQGESLAGCLAREKRLSPERTVAIMTQVARALGRAHAAGIVHRDLKPDNVFLVKEDDQELVKVLDFGIAKTPQAQFGGMETRTGVTMGTPYYMSPEQMEGKRAVDFRTDLWAMAVITSECMTGVRPFDGSTFGELLLNVCARPIPMPSSQGLTLRGLDEWFTRATNRDPEQRFASAQELVTTLKDVVTGAGAAGFTQLPSAEPTQGYAPARTGIAAPERASRSRALPWILVGVLASGVVLGGVLWLLRRQASAEAAETPSALPASAAVPSPPSPLGASSPSSAPTPSETARREPSSAPSALPPPNAKLATPPSNSSKPVASAATSPVVAPPSTKALRCFADPFSGLIRPATSQPGSATFACKQDPFTGKYKRL